jgi:colicin import membrane protein
MDHLPRFPRWMRAAAALALLGFAAGPLLAGGGDGERERLVNDQSQIFDRLTSLKKRMERLAEKLEAEGNTYKASLLKKSLAEVDARAMEARKDDLLRKLKDSSLQTYDAQEKLLADLSDIVKLLMDERRFTDVEKKLKELQETRANLRDIRNAEHTLREKTEDQTGDQAQALARLEQQLEELLAKQQQLGKESAQEAQRRADEGAAERAELEQKLDQLAQAQAEAVKRLEQEARAKIGNAEQALDLAREAAKKGDAEALREAARRVGDARSESSAADHPADARDPALQEKLRALEQALSDAADRAAADKKPAGEKPTGEKPTGEKSATGSDPAAAKPEDALAKSLQDAQEAMKSALQSAGKPSADPAKPDAAAQAMSESSQLEQALAAQAKELADALAKRAQEKQERAAEAAASKSLDQAQEHLAQAGSELKKPDLSRGLDQARDALDRLEQARDALAREGEATRARQKALADRQDFLRGETEKARQDAQAATDRKNSSVDPAAKQQLDQSLAQAGGQMRDATQSLQQSDPQGAQPSQQQAEESLSKALEKVKDARQKAGRDAQQRDAAAQQAQMKQLADEQQKIEEQLRDLMPRMKEKEQKQGQEQGDAARRAMNRAKQQLDQQDGEQATQSEKEAEKNLDQMDQQLREDETRYQNLRSEEVLFRLKEKLADLKKRATALHDAIAGVDAERAGAEILPRRLRPKAQQLADETDAIRKDNDDAHDRVAKEGSPTFPWVLEKNSSDLEEISQELNSREKNTGTFVQVLASDVVGRYERLLQAFDDELKRRQEARKGRTRWCRRSRSSCC